MRTKLKKKKNETAWHKWFAWYPIYIHRTGQWVWLEKVERLKILDYCGGGDFFTRTTYKLIKK